MTRRRSLQRKKSNKKQQSKKKLRRRRSQKLQFGKKQSDLSNTTKELEKNDNFFNFFSNWINPTELVKLLIFTKNVSNNTLKAIKPDDNTELGFREKIERFIIKLYRSRIKDFFENLTPRQIILLTEGKYNKEIREKILFNTEPSTTVKISGLKENAKLLFLKTIFGKVLIKNIKNFIESLTPTQLVLLINGKFDLDNAMYNSFLNTKYPTTKSVKKQDLNDLNLI